LHVPESDNLKIVPKNSFYLDPGASTTVELHYSAVESGIYRGAIDVTTNGKAFLSSIDINATCVDYMQFIIDSEGKELSVVSFGEVLFG
jgi:hypothetical protein